MKIDVATYVTSVVMNTGSPLEAALEMGTALAALVFAVGLESQSTPKAQGQVVGAALLEVFRRHPELIQEIKDGVQIAVDNADKAPQ